MKSYKALVPGIPGSREGLRQAIPGRALEIRSKAVCPETLDHGHNGHERRLESGGSKSTRDDKEDEYHSEIKGRL